MRLKRGRLSCTCAHPSVRASCLCCNWALQPHAVPPPLFPPQSHAWNNPHHPFTIVANLLWALFFGWQLALMHLAAGLVQAITIVGFGTALTSLQLAAFAM